jgi:hypothetical protein
MRVKSALKYLYRNPKTGVYTGYWTLSRPTTNYVGAWPPGLLNRTFQVIGKPKTILEPFAGRSKLGVSIDLNPEVKPHIRADAQHLPIRENSFDAVLMDPPYSEEASIHYSDRWTRGRKLPFSIYKALDEAKRIVKPGGYLVLLHTLIVKHPDVKTFKRIAVIGIGTGPNKRIRALQIFRKRSNIQATIIEEEEKKP